VIAAEKLDARERVLEQGNVEHRPTGLVLSVDISTMVHQIAQELVGCPLDVGVKRCFSTLV